MSELSWADRKKAVDEAVARYPGEFGLRAYPGDRFRLERRDSYWTDLDGGGPMLYTHILNKDGKWRSFCKGTERELKREMVAIPPRPVEKKLVVRVAIEDENWEHKDTAVGLGHALECMDYRHLLGELLCALGWVNIGEDNEYWELRIPEDVLLELRSSLGLE